MKKLLIVACVLFSIVSANSQNLTVEGTAPELYVTHTVAPKENFYSVGRLYNQNPKAIASFNKVVMEKGLTIGQKIKIPLNSQNLGAGETGSGGGSSIPLTHFVAKSETLTKIGTDFNVTAAQIKKWNNLSADNIAPGTPLVVGHLNMESAPAASQSSAPVAAVKKPDVTPKKEVAVEKPKSFEPEPKKEEPFATVEPVTKSETPTKVKAGGYGRQTEKTTTVEEKPIVQEEPVKETSKKSSKPAAKEVVKEEPMSSVAIDESVKEKPVVQEEPVKETPKKSKKSSKEPVAKEEPVKNVSTDELFKQEPVKEESAKDEPAKEEPKTKEKRSAKKDDNKKVDYSNTASLSSIEGVFAGLYPNAPGQKSLNTKTGEAATFKSTSGWQDKKYYVLMNDVTPGTILKIAAAENENKVIYAKVLGGMPEMKENNGLLIRMSNAAASYLGIIDPKFQVQISYYQ